MRAHTNKLPNENIRHPELLLLSKRDSSNEPPTRPHTRITQTQRQKAVPLLLNKCFSLQNRDATSNIKQSFIATLHGFPSRVDG